MTIFDPDILFTGAKEALKAFLVGFGFLQFIRGRGWTRISLWYFGLGLGLACLVAGFVLFLPLGWNIRNFLSRLIGYEFILLYMAAVLAIYQASGVRVFPDLPRMPGMEPMARYLCVFLAVLYFSPDYAGSLLFLHDMAFVLETAVPVVVSGVAGVCAIGAVALFLRRRFSHADFSTYFGPIQFLLFLAVVKLALGGTQGFVEYSLIPSIQALTMKFVHDVVHHSFTIILVPDHPLLAVTTWNFIGFFFGSNFGLMVAFVLLLLPPALYVKRLLIEPLPGVTRPTAAERRLWQRGARDARRRGAILVGIFLMAVLGAWFIRGSGESIEIYVPVAKPVVEDKGVVVIPLKDPTMDLRDGRIHTFALNHEGEVMTLLIATRPDGSLATCLNACEICPPDGYGQKADTVICLYCNTPITTDTLGKPGGCNPIPLKAEVTASDIRIQVSEITARWQDVKSGKTRENAP